VQFETWRKTRNSRQPIPDQLWQAAFKLSKNYSIYKIAKTLQLDYTKLKNFTSAGTNHHLPIVKDISPAFIELGIGACSSDRLGFIFPSFNLRYGIIQGYFTQPILTLFCIIATAYRKLIQKPNGVNNTHLFE